MYFEDSYMSGLANVGFRLGLGLALAWLGLARLGLARLGWLGWGRLGWLGWVGLAGSAGLANFSAQLAVSQFLPISRLNLL